MRGQRHALAAPYPRERPGTHFTRGWVGTQGRSGQVRDISPPAGFDSRTVQPVGSRYTDYATRPTAEMYEGRTESHEQLFFANELGRADEGEYGGRWNQLLCYP